MDTVFTLFGISKYFETLSPFCCLSYDVEGFQGARPGWVCICRKGVSVSVLTNHFLTGKTMSFVVSI